MANYRLETKKKSYLEFFLFIGIILYAFLIVLTNYSSNAFYNYDMYSDQLYARLVSEEGTIFPSDWVFGNQYYVIATPVLAGMLNHFLQNSFLSMATASTIMFLIILAVFYWSFQPFFDRLSLLTGLFCLSGGVILGDSASSHISGLQLFYTMASYYACYVIGLLFTLGVWLRLKKGMEPGFLSWVLAIIISITLGMQSLREMLVLYIPLAIYETLVSIRSRKINIPCALFIIYIFAGNIIGLVLIHFCPVKSSPIISEVKFDLHPNNIINNFCLSIQSFFQLTSIPYLTFVWKWKILGAIGLFYTLTAASVTFVILFRRDHTIAAQTIIFLVLSIFGVLFVGTLLFRVRDIYFFAWFLLLVLVFMYLVSTIHNATLKSIILVFLLFTGAVNLFYNFYPDYAKRKELTGFYSSVAEDLTEKGITTIFFDMNTPPTVASISDDSITAIAYSYNGDRDAESLLSPVPFLQAKTYAENVDPDLSLIVLSDYQYSDYSSYEYLELFTSESYRHRLFSKLELIDEQSCTYVTLYFYRFSDPGILSS